MPERRPSTRPGQPPRRPHRGASETRLIGLHAIREAWLNPERTCRRLWATDAGLRALAASVERARALGLRRPAPETVERGRLDRLVAAGAVHQGAVLEADPLPPVDLEDVGRSAALRDAAAVVVLDRVTDPHNVGAVLRSAAAFGALAVVAMARHAPDVTGTLAKAASGAVEHVPLVRVGNLARALARLGELGFRRIGLAEDGDRTLADAVRDAPKVALVLGAEGPGLRRLTRDTCDALARLPTAGPIASLNVSNAAAVALYELARGRAD